MAMYNAHCVYGYYEKDVPVIVTGRLSLQPHAQAGYVEYKDGWIALISYESEIFRIKYHGTDKVEISFQFSQAAPNYSRTTARHVSSFCKQFCKELTYKQVLDMYYDHREWMPCR